MNKISSILWGLVLVALGVIFGLNALEITSIDIFFDGWWTLFIIVPCLIGLITDKDKTGSLIGLLIGTLLLLAIRDIISFEIISKLALPIILVIIGLSIIFKNTITTKINKKIKELTNNELFSYTATFSGENVKFPNKEFIGANINAVFGGVDMDLRNSIITKEAVINTSAIFGGVNILVPNDINVIVKSTSIFGGTDNKVNNTDTENRPTIYINAFNLFGGVEVK